MSRNDSLDHAKHNKEVCEYLSKKSEYSDWVITTAFYSAIHFTDHKIFPLTSKQNGEPFTYVSFNKYWAVYSKKKHINKHKVKLELVEDELPEVAPNYSILKDLSHTARYVNYKYDSWVANHAKKNLEAIEKFCKK
ncbi:MAG: hypothetical protein GY928_30165 [Colwellia sp.]|nr:hypothetical protein [Colwellia sp.]